MSLPGPVTALVLAGTRPGGDPLARHAGAVHKALIDVGGQPMLARVLRALAEAPGVGRIVVVTDQPELMENPGLAGCDVTVMSAAPEGPSASVAALLESQGAPLLVTTADHALLRTEWITAFLESAASSGADALVALATREAVLAAAPGSQRTWLRFADGEFSGCNIFLLRTSRAAGIVRFWREMEVQRKRPLAMLRRLGLLYVLRYRFGRLTLPAALARLGQLSNARLAPVLLEDGRAAIDVDKPADLDLVRAMLRDI